MSCAEFLDYGRHGLPYPLDRQQWEQCAEGEAGGVAHSRHLVAEAAEGERREQWRKGNERGAELRQPA